MDTVSGTLVPISLDPRHAGPHHAMPAIPVRDGVPRMFGGDLPCALDVLGIAACGLTSLASMPDAMPAQGHPVLAAVEVAAGAVAGGLLLRRMPEPGGHPAVAAAWWRSLAVTGLLGALGLLDGALGRMGTQGAVPWVALWAVLSALVAMLPRAGALPGRARAAMTAPMPGWGGVAKAATDRVVALLALLLLSPLLLALALAVRLDSPGPAIFRQEREGLHGRRFTMLKFRSMRADANEAGTLRQTERGDGRCTALGALLRRTSLDELPQLINVLRGDMSLVGPRPHALAMRTEGCSCHELVAEYGLRHRVKPGLTGWAQVNGARGATATAEELRRRVALDLDYIRAWSFWLDLRIMALTAVRLLRDEGAF